jgi:hypothetical protein
MATIAVLRTSYKRRGLGPARQIGSRYEAGARRTRYADNLCALPPCAKGDTLQGAKYLPAREARQLADSNEGPASRESRGSWNAAIFVGLVLLVAILFTAYVLLWNGGAPT